MKPSQGQRSVPHRSPMGRAGTRSSLPAFAILIMLTSGCARSSIEPFRSEFFSRPPEIWEKEGKYHLRLYEPALDLVGFSFAETKTMGRDLHVWVSVLHSSGSNPNRLIPLNMAVPTHGPAPRFWWRDPVWADEALHEMTVRRVEGP